MPTYNKIVFNGQTLIDLSNDTVDSSDDIAEGLVGHLNNGTSVTGTASGGGGGGSASDAVRFIDYDGTILHTYSAAEFAALTAMPANPTHTGLTSQGWNWTLADAKAQVTAMGSCDIGQMYITDDGKTRIYISLVDSTRLSPYLGIAPNGTVVVDWGDNTATDTITGTVSTSVQHTYASTGDYVITLTVTSGSFSIYGSTNGSSLLKRTASDAANQQCYENAVKKVELGANVSINSNAFQLCYSLSSITIPNNVTSILSNAFYSCFSLKSLTIPSGTTSIENYSIYQCYSLTSIAIPNSVTAIKDSAFSNTNSLSRISIPSGVTTMGNYVFQSCYALTNVTIPSGVTSISTNAFQNCYLFTNITIPSGVTAIGNYAFANCNALASITIPDSVTSIGQSAFSSCYALESATIPSGVTVINASAFYNCRALSNVTIPNGVTSIGTSAFSSCHALESATIPSGVSSITASAFKQCSSLSSITIPNGVTSIESSAFYACHSLSSITVPSSVTSINTQAFQNCYGVAEYHFLSTTPPTLANTNAFTGILADCKIYVPAASLTAYQEATNWSTYASRMVGE